jgi:hypothetical protein
MVPLASVIPGQREALNPESRLIHCMLIEIPDQPLRGCPD